MRGYSEGEKMEKLLGKKLGDTMSCVPYVGQPSLDPWAGERVNPVVFTLVSHFLCYM